MAITREEIEKGIAEITAALKRPMGQLARDALTNDLIDLRELLAKIDLTERAEHTRERTLP